MDRKQPKTSIAPGARKAFTDLDALIETLPGDDDMRGHDPLIERDTTVRVEEKKRNVRVPARIITIKLEADQDWHVIIGHDRDRTPIVNFSAEISDLPANSASAYGTLKKVRQSVGSDASTRARSRQSRSRRHWWPGRKEAPA